MKSSTRSWSVGRSLPAEDDVQVLRLPALDGRQLLDVGADLEDRRRLDVAGELGVRDLVVPRPERAVRLARIVVSAEQEVRVAAPRPVEERRLVHDVRAAAHRRDRLLGRRPQLGAGVARRRLAQRVERRDRRPVLVDLDDAPPLARAGPRGTGARARCRAWPRARSRGRSGSASPRAPRGRRAPARAGGRRRGSPRGRWRRRRVARRSVASPPILRGGRASSRVTAA